MSNENNVEAETTIQDSEGSDNTETVGEENIESKDDSQKESTKEKVFETPEARLARLERQAKQLRKKLGLEEEVKDKPKKKSDDFDYGEKAFLIANGIKLEESEFVREFMKETGKKLEDVLGSKYFQASLKERREVEVAEKAMPNTSNRSVAANPRDSVEYWLEKGELPPPDKTELRRAYVNAKVKAQSNNSKFTRNPVVI